MGPHITQKQPEMTQVPEQTLEFDEKQFIMNDKTIQNFMHDAPPGIQSQSRQTCLIGIVFLILLVLFLIFGNAIFGFFHIQNIYHFIIAVLIIIVLYVISMAIAGLFIKPPKDILSITTDRLRN